MSSQLYSEPVAVDPYDYSFQDDPYPTYQRLRDEDPFHHSAEHDFWLLTRYADVHAVMRTDGDVLSNRMGVSLDASAWSPHAHTTMSFLAMDPPDQTRLRKLVSKGFTPRRVAGLEPQIQRITDHYLDRCLEQGELDWIGDVAGKVPMDVISEMVGVPPADRDEIRRLSDLLVHREPGVRDVTQEGIEAAITLFGYYADLLEEKKQHPADDLTSALLSVEDDHDQMSGEEIAAFLFLMVVAGNETTTKLLGNAAFHLTRHPDQLERVFAAADHPDSPDLVDAWIEETLRHDTSTQLLARLVEKDLTLHGRTAPAGSRLLLGLGAANHDERVFTDPERFDLDRDPAELRQIMSFGGGRHFCLGANLARLESQVVLRALVRRCSSIDVDHDRAVRFYSANVRGFRHLPMRVQLR